MKSKPSKKRSPIFAAFALLSLTALLTSCESVPRVEAPYSPASQADYLYLKKGQPIQTEFGTYTPPQDEKFVAEWKYLRLERENLDQTEALRVMQTKLLLQGR